jgi:hypothetical protein
MTGEFLTEGLQADRYLKAIRLITQFENEIEAILRQFDQQMVDAQPELFDPSTDPDWRNSRNTSSALANHRINHEMEGPQAPDDRRQRLNVHLYWMPPTEYNRTDINGALRVFGYKIKGADQAVDNQVVEQTRNGDWSIRTSENPFDSNIDFYRHVDSLAEIEEAQTELVGHFSEFGNEYVRS